MIINRPHENLVQIIIQKPSEIELAKQKLLDMGCKTLKFIPGLLVDCPEYWGQFKDEEAA